MNEVRQSEREEKTYEKSGVDGAVGSNEGRLVVDHDSGLCGRGFLNARGQPGQGKTEGRLHTHCSR